ncbi:hypothetical protein HZA97_02555 [Candidatus Woesearchaeota archaeon]|nr:hypothetical protein [Candidatus Woesearchaeota archaeon]
MVGLDLSVLLRYYKRKEIQEVIVEHAENKEVAIKYAEGYGKRPDVLQHPSDVLEFAKKGATSFHASEELWYNPLQLNTALKKTEIEELRRGWDLVLDVDSKFFDYAKITANLIVQALRHHDIDCLSVKFSGNNGFHIGVPFEAFPDFVHDVETRTLFPEGPRRVASYLKQMIKPHLIRELLNFQDLEKIQITTGKKREELIENKEFDPFSIVDIDTILISSRHLYRMPYTFNEKSGLISLPINPSKILEFNRESAKWNEIVVEHKFIDRTKAQPNQAKKLFVQSFDSTIEKEIYGKIEITETKEFRGSETAVPVEYFPPCIKNILNGLKDGKKRSLFILVNFLTCAGWKYDDIKKLLAEWNKKNQEQLREGIIESHLRYHERNKKKVLPPNCNNMAYYKGFGVCTPDNFCSKIKNPANYAILKQKGAERFKKKDKKGKTKVVEKNSVVEIK